MEPYPVFIWIGGPEGEEREQKDAEIQAAVTRKEQEFGRPLTSKEILQTMGEVIEPDPSKRKFLSSGPPTSMPEPR